MVIYVDDIVITINGENAILVLKVQLQNILKNKDLGRLHYILEIEVSHLDDDIFYSQSKYTLNILNEN